jgi:ABC-type hemin transport system ATPase subunit
LIVYVFWVNFIDSNLLSNKLPLSILRIVDFQVAGQQTDAALHELDLTLRYDDRCVVLQGGPVAGAGDHGFARKKCL